MRTSPPWYPSNEMWPLSVTIGPAAGGLPPPSAGFPGVGSSPTTGVGPVGTPGTGALGVPGPGVPTPSGDGSVGIPGRGSSGVPGACSPGLLGSVGEPPSMGWARLGDTLEGCSPSPWPACSAAASLRAASRTGSVPQPAQTKTIPMASKTRILAKGIIPDPWSLDFSRLPSPGRSCTWCARSTFRCCFP
jgi:hypothetical protein